MEKIVSLCKRRGFIYQSSEIYGGINGFWDYGPLGAELKRNVKELWWNDMIRQRDDVVGLEATIIMSPQIWKASGHVDTFADMMRECPVTKKRVRADQVEPQSGTVYVFIGVLSDPEDGKLYHHDTPETDLGRRVLEDYVKGERPKNLVALDVIKLALFARERLKPFNEQRSPEDLAALANNLALKIAEEVNRTVIKILVPNGKPFESAQKKAIEYAEAVYRQKNSWPVGWESYPVSSSQDFHPESGFELGIARPFNLMFKTYVGPVESEDNVAYLRPETAQAIFAQFKNVLETSRQKVPFGIAQVGKAFRNEVTPRNFTFRSREFEQMELEFFIKPDEVVEAINGNVSSVSQLSTLNPQPNWGWEAWHKYWVEERIAFYEGIGLPRTTLEEYWQKPEELAHYAKACVDILFKFPFGTQELEGIAARSDFDLSQHERFSGKPMGVFDEELRAAWTKLEEARKGELSKCYYEARLKYLTKMGVEPAKAEKEAKDDASGLAKGQYIPHVIEPSAGVDRLILALICNAYSEATETDDKGKTETRVILKFHPRVAPIKAAVLPLLKNKPELVKKAQEVRDLLRPWMNVFYDDGGSIGRRYARQDEAGTSFCVTIDFDTLGEKPELKDTVTIRYRDDGKQERLAIGELLNWLLPKIR
ncbi:MAG TPA: glycine--tRNA ligase [Verrucomicrobiae bacterium]|nr:glycine--tRNA ligase [Verrucomicrobiae bacterium]